MPGTPFLTSVPLVKIESGTFISKLRISNGDLFVGQYGLAYVTQNAGIVSVNAELVIAKETDSFGRYTLNGGTLNVSELILGNGDAAFTWNDGVLSAETVSFNLTNSTGTFDVKATSEIKGTYTQGANGGIRFNITSTQNYSHLDVTGVLTLEGALELNLLDKSQLANGDSFDLFDAASVSVTFDTLILPEADSSLTWNTTLLYSDGIVSLQYVFPYDRDGDGVSDHLDAYVDDVNRSTADVVITTPPAFTTYGAAVTTVSVTVDGTVWSSFDGYWAYTVNEAFTKTNILASGTTTNFSTFVTFNISVVSNTAYTFRVGLVDGATNVITTTDVDSVIFSIDEYDSDYFVSSTNQTLVLWLDAEHPEVNSGTRPSDGDSMQYWYDRSYYAEQAVQNSPSKRPAYESTDGYSVKFVLGDRLVREDIDPHLAATLDVTGHGDTGGLDLAGGDPPGLEGLDAVVAVADLGGALGAALHASTVVLAVLDLLGHQHDRNLSRWPGSSGSRTAHEWRPRWRPPRRAVARIRDRLP